MSLPKTNILEVHVDEISIPTANGHSLVGYRFTPQIKENNTVVITSATGVLQKYYAKFAEFLALKGITVYTFDYHGIGKSHGTEKDLKNNTSNATSWGQNDQAAVVALAKEENPNTKLALVAHSIGGQLLGFNPNYHMLDKVVLVACQNGYWTYFKGLHKIKMLFFWHVLIPLATPIFGYFPAKKLGLFENLPKQMIYEWGSWGKKPDYFMHFFEEKKYFFKKFDITMLFLSFSKDSFAPKATVDWLTDQYKNATIHRVHHRAAKGERHVKHFGFFKSWAQKPFWEQCHNYIVNGSYES